MRYITDAGSDFLAETRTKIPFVVIAFPAVLLSRERLSRRRAESAVKKTKHGEHCHLASRQIMSQDLDVFFRWFAQIKHLITSIIFVD